MSSVTDLREDLERIRAAAQAGETARVIGLVERALQALDGSRLLTTTEAAEFARHSLGQHAQASRPRRWCVL